MINFLKALFVLVVMILVIGSFWAHFAAPCEYFKYLPGKDIPGRCLMANN